MGVMAQIAMEREDALNEAHWEYREAYDAMMKYQDQHPPAHRKPHETDKLSRLSSRCMSAKYRYEMAQSQRYRV